MRGNLINILHQKYKDTPKRNTEDFWRSTENVTLNLEPWMSCPHSDRLIIKPVLQMTSKPQKSGHCSHIATICCMEKFCRCLNNSHCQLWAHTLPLSFSIMSSFQLHLIQVDQTLLPLQCEMLHFWQQLSFLWQTLVLNHKHWRQLPKYKKWLHKKGV